MNNPPNYPDLQSILSTLASLVPQPTPTQSTPSAPAQQHPLDRKEEPPRSQTQDPRTRPAAGQLHVNGDSQQQQKIIDPATITTWQDGLRCVTKLAQQNAQFAGTLQRMMRDQRGHERRWLSERQALQHTQANRAASTARAQAILRSLNPHTPSLSNSTNGIALPASNGDGTASSAATAELAAFDRKIYLAQLAMQHAMTAELKALGVPFFGTDPSLVVPDGDDLPQDLLPPDQDHPRWSPRVSAAQLRTLQRRIVQHLEDLYRDYRLAI